MADVKEYKCPSCGAPMRFDINRQRMLCTFCSNGLSLEYTRLHFNEVTDEKQSDFDWVDRTKYVWEPDMLEELVEYTCSSCGGNIITKNTSASARCPFCNHDLIISSNFSGDLRPDRVIPFRVGAEEFAEKYRQTIARYAPKAFRDPSITDNIVGCYIPVWLYSCVCDTYVDLSNKRSFKVTDFPVPGTDIKKDVFYSVAPFWFNHSVKFTESCLTGFYASRYTIGAEHAMEFADEEVKKSCCLQRVGALDRVEQFPASFDVNAYSKIRNQKLTYYLVPVWFMNVKYKRKEYTLAMNGQTGKLAAPDVPFSYKGKLVYGLIFAFFELLIIIIAYFLCKNFADDLLSTLMITIPFIMIFTFYAYGETEWIWSKISYKYIGGLKKTPKYYYNVQKHYIDKEEKLKRIKKNNCGQADVSHTSADKKNP
ncbi:hypothetical protein [Ruminococcus sp.]|uniref:hypothetical protein n=1 Tax=Ruminococcus sp. TaxID=41978 RepID=UPI0025E8F869|nr:hypothetical protein [Ruminococcus sp.]